MSIWDDHNPINIPFPTGGGNMFWENLASRNGYRLQKNKITEHCRIIDRDDVRVAWGLEGPMRAEFRKLTCKPESLRARYGDVIGIHRRNGLYDHYGVYETSGCVYEYAAKDGDFGDVRVQTTTLKKFLAGSDSYFVLTFPQHYGAPGKVSVAIPRGPRSSSVVPREPPMLAPALTVRPSPEDYHLYTPEETIQRARSRLGEKKYDLAFNNCEHFAIWCKTGVSQSFQADAVLNAARLVECLIYEIKTHPVTEQVP